MILRTGSLSAFLLIASASHAQPFAGKLSFPEGKQQQLTLWATRGGEHLRLDSTRTDAQGSFNFNRPRPGAGFYQLSINDSDRVDVILTPQEKEVAIEFTGTPLQYHVHVLKSDENMRLWEYKLVSREAQAVQAAADAERRTLDPTDVRRARELDSVGFRAHVLREQHLGRLMAAAPTSYFTKVVGANQRVDRAREGGRSAVARAFDFSDPDLLRSSVYAHAVATYLQSAEPRSEDEFYRGIDSLLLLTSRDTACFNYTFGFLLDLFGQYGPELAVQYMVDTYIAQVAHPIPIPASMRAKVEEALLMTVGRTAPDIDLPDHDRIVKLSTLAAAAHLTAVMFYGSTCDHCREQMKGVRDTYATYQPKGLELIGIALDNDSAEFNTAIREEGITWPTYSEFKAWGSPAAKAFQAKATPSFFLLDRDLRILAKPANYLELALRIRKILH